MPARPGRPSKLADSEALALMILAQCRHDRSERAFLAYARVHLRSFFPCLPSQSAFNRQTRRLMWVLAALGPLIRERALTVLDLPAAAYEVLDGVPVPLMQCCRGRQHKVFRDEAAFGRGGSDRAWYYGLKMLVAIDNHGFISGFLAGPANTEERWLAEALFRWRCDLTLPTPTADQLAQVLGPSHRAGGQRQGPTGPLGPCTGVGQPSSMPSIADLNYFGEDWSRHWCDHYGAVALTEAIYRNQLEPDRGRARRWLHGKRQLVETVNSGLVRYFGLKFPLARTLFGLWARLGAKVAAHNCSVLLNHLFDEASLSACSLLP